LQAAARYRHQLGELVEKEVGLRLKLAKFLKAHGVTFSGVSPSTVLRFEEDVAFDGLPASMIASLQSQGADAQTLDDIKREITNLPPKEVAALSKDPFADPSLIASLRATAHALRMKV